MAKQSVLFEIHKKNGARIAERWGSLLPLHFGDPAREYQFVRSRAGLVDLCHRSAFKVTGPDRFSYFQGMVSNDLKNLTVGQGMYATILNLQGKVLADVRILALADAFLVDLWEPLQASILEHLNRYLVADEVEIVDVTQDYAMLSVQGPEADVFMRKLAIDSVLPRATLDHAAFEIDGIEVRIVRYSWTGEEGYDFMVARKNLLAWVARIEEAGKSSGLEWVGDEASEILRIESGIPRYGVDFDSSHLLLETGLDHAVSFTKGCYLGQEVVERIRSRGHVNKKLLGLLLEGDCAASAGDAILCGDKEAGTVTSSTFAPKLGFPVALGYIHRDFWSPGTQLFVCREGALIPAEVRALPFEIRTRRKNEPLDSPTRVR